jgi:hypothetical protein
MIPDICVHAFGGHSVPLARNDLLDKYQYPTRNEIFQFTIISLTDQESLTQYE